MLDILKQCKIFKSLSIEEINCVLKECKCVKHSYNSNNIIFYEGHTLDNLVVILEGKVKVVQCDDDGNEWLMNTLNKSDMINENVVFTEHKVLPFRIIAVENTKLLFINIVEFNKFQGDIKNKMILNLLSSSAQKNIVLTQKIQILSQKSTKDKILLYLNMLSKTQQSRMVIIPFNREEMAKFLCVDRSGLCKELMKLKKEGAIDYRKNIIVLKPNDKINC